MVTVELRDTERMEKHKIPRNRIKLNDLTTQIITKLRGVLLKTKL